MYKLSDVLTESLDSNDVLFDPEEGVITFEEREKNLKLLVRGGFQDENTKRFILEKLELLSIKGAFIGLTTFEEIAEIKI